MGIYKLIATLCSKFKCKSACSFNNELFDIEFNDFRMTDFQLKNKDIMKIHAIFKKRKLTASAEYRKSIRKTNDLTEITEI